MAHETPTEGELEDRIAAAVVDSVVMLSQGCPATELKKKLSAALAACQELENRALGQIPPLLGP